MDKSLSELFNNAKADKDKGRRIEVLQHAVKIAAKVVALYGEVYLPIFTKLHLELVKEQKIESEKDLAWKLVSSYLEGDTPNASKKSHFIDVD